MALTDYLPERHSVGGGGHGNVRWGGYRPTPLSDYLPGKVKSGMVVSGDLLPTLITPQMVKDKAKQVEAFIFSLNRDIRSGSTTLDENFMSGWNSFVLAWNKFHADIESGGISNVLGAKGNMEQTEQYERDAIGWQSNFKSRGGITSAPPPTPPPENKDLSSFSEIAKYGSIAVIVIGAVILLKK